MMGRTVGVLIAKTARAGWWERCLFLLRASFRRLLRLLCTRLVYFIPGCWGADFSCRGDARVPRLPLGRRCWSWFASFIAGVAGITGSRVSRGLLELEETHGLVSRLARKICGWGVLLQFFFGHTSACACCTLWGCANQPCKIHIDGR